MNMPVKSWKKKDIHGMPETEKTETSPVSAYLQILFLFHSVLECFDGSFQ